MNHKITNIINNTFLMSLATNTETGIWVSDVIYVTDGTMPALYWISSPDTKHSKALAVNPECAVSVTLTQKASDQKLGIQMQGFAHEVQGDTYHLTCLHAEKQGLSKPKSTEEYCEGDIWYVFYPYVIEIFDEKEDQKELITLLDKNEIANFKKHLLSKGYLYTFLWFDIPNHEYALHKHIHPVEFYVLHGGVTFTYDNNSLKTVSKGEVHNEIEGSIHSAQVSSQGCVYMVGQINSDEPSIDL